MSALFLCKNITIFQSTLPRGERLIGSGRFIPPRRISIHAPARGATSCAACSTSSAQISIHAPARGATWEHTPPCVTLYISIHAPARGATLIAVTAPTAAVISIHAPARGATILTGLYSFSTIQFQSTLPRGERPIPNADIINPISISIHAPARGATAPVTINSAYRTISIHAPARGATANITYFFYARVPFLSNIHKFQHFLTIQI